MKDDSRIEFDASTGAVRSGPRQIFLEVSSRCNLNCVHCSKDFGSIDGHPELDLPIATIRKLRPWLERAEFVNLNMVGESLLHPDFLEIVDLSCSGPAQVGLNTNGLLLTESLCEHLVRARVGSLVVSIDGMESNEPIRGIPYEMLREKVVLLDAVKKRLGAKLPYLGVAYTLMRRNLAELPRLLADLIPRVQLQFFHVQPLIVFYETVKDENIYFEVGADDVLESCAIFARAHGTRFTMFRSTFKADERNPHGDKLPGFLGQASLRFGCIDPFYEIKIRSDGSVMSCSYGLTPGLNVNTNTLDEIWNHEWYRALRLRLVKRIFANDCERCPYVFGSAENQTGHLRRGVEHSAAARFRAASSRVPASSMPMPPFKPATELDSLFDRDPPAAKRRTLGA